MGYSNIKEIATDVETTYATNQSETYRTQRVVEGSVKLRTPVHKLEDKSSVARLNARNHHKNGSQFGAGLSASFYVDSLAAALTRTGSYTAPGHDLGEIIKAGFGAVRGGVGSKTDGTGGTATAIPVDSASGFTTGGAFAMNNTSTGRWEIRGIYDISGSTLAPRSALGFTPNSDDLEVYSCTTFYLDEDGVGGDGQSLVVRCLGYQATDQWLFRGCVPASMTLKTPLDDYVTLDVDFAAATWENTTGETAASSVLSGSPPIVAKLGEFAWISESATTHHTIACHEYSINFGINNVLERTFDGIQTAKRGRMKRLDKPQVSMTVRVFRGAYGGNAFTQFWTDADSESAYRQGTFICGSQPRVSNSGTGMFAIETPRLQYAKEPELVDEGDGFQDVKLVFDANEDGITTVSETVDIARSAIRWHSF